MNGRRLVVGRFWRFHGRKNSAVVLSLIFALTAGAIALGQSTAERRTLDEVKALYESGDFEHAAKLAAAAQPHSADLGLYYGLALVKMGDVETAESAFQAEYARYQQDARFAEELAGLAYRRKSSRDAKRWLQRALAHDHSRPYANDFLGLLFLADENLPAAIKYWNRIGKPLVQDVRIEGAPRLNSLLLDRALAVSSGQVLTVDRLEMTRSNLDRLGVFGDYSFSLVPRPDPRFDLTLRSGLAIGNLSGWAGKLLPYVRGLPYQTVYLDLTNVGGRAMSLSSLARWDSNKRRIAINFTSPFRLNPRWIYKLSLDARDERWDLTTSHFAKSGDLNGLNLRKVEAVGGTEYAITSRLAWTTELLMAKRSFQNHPQADYFTNSVSARFRNGLSYVLWNWPEHRVRADGNFSLDTGRILTGVPGREVIARGRVATTWLPLSKGDDLSAQLNFSSARIFGSAPFDDYYMLGMERDNDTTLWMRGHLGARDGRKGSAPLGTRYLVLQTEVDRTIFKLPFVKLQMGPFIDIGRIGDPHSQFGSSGWLTDAGLQAKIRTPGRLTLSLIYGRDLRHGHGVFYTSISK